MSDLLVFLPTCFALNLAFGPSNLLAVTHGALGGVRYALLASVSRLLAFAPMIAVSALGLSLLLSASAAFFGAIKIVGAAYLVWLGLKLIRSTPDGASAKMRGARPPLGQAFRTEFFTAASNPKAILVFAALFPQFVDTANYWSSYALLGAIFLALEVVAILIYAALGQFAASMASDRLHWFQRVSGAGMIFFGVLLLFAPQPAAMG